MKAGWLSRTVAVVLVMLSAGCDLTGEQVHRGRVLDQDTGEPIAGAIVVGRYMGGISWGGSSCNRAESAVSDAQGWFELPVDPKDGTPLMEAYKYGYDRGNPTRYAILKNRWPTEWRVSVQKWNDANTAAEIVAIEPEIYRTESAAQAASGEKSNVFVRRSRGNRERRLDELHSFQKSCLGPPIVSDGLAPLLEAMLREQVDLGDSEDAIASTRRRMEYSPGRPNGSPPPSAPKNKP